MKELAILLSITVSSQSSSIHHNSAILNNEDGKTILLFERIDDEKKLLEMSTKEYWQLLKNRPSVLESLSKHDLQWLNNVLSGTKDIIIYQVDLALSESEIRFYFIYEFKKLIADLDLNKWAIKVYERLKEDREYKMPFDSFITLNSIIRDKVKEMNLKLLKLQCKCGHTFYVDGNIDRCYDKCIYCGSSENLNVVKNNVQITKAV